MLWFAFILDVSYIFSFVVTYTGPTSALVLGPNSRDGANS